MSEARSDSEVVRGVAKSSSRRTSNEGKAVTVKGSLGRYAGN
jgi:hypothetical protein